MMKRKALMTLGIVLLLFCFWYFHLRVYRENKLIDEGNVMVKKIENFKNKNNRLPQSLEEIGMKEKDGANVLDYNIDRMVSIIEFLSSCQLITLKYIIQIVKNGKIIIEI